jgi:thymidylate synthase (FAD)
MQAHFVTEPVVAVIGEMRLRPTGIQEMLDWVKSRAPACVPERDHWHDLFPHSMMRENGDVITDNELLVELAGRKCYNSFGEKAGRKTNGEYIANTQAGEIHHASILYHAKMTFFIAGVSRRVSHELIRNYVGADRTEEGAPSQESTRYVENAGFYVVPPRYLEHSDPTARTFFEEAAQENYRRYLGVIVADREDHLERTGTEPKGMDHKRMLEAASSFLLHSVETSFLWTTNPAALAKLFHERCDAAADLEFQRFAKVWKRICLERWPNLFPQPWMK